jgi:hypothetical protein
VVQPVVITGTPGSSPTLPPLTQTTTGIFQIPISNWTSASSGSLTGLVDQRQYSGRSIIMMTSAWHPTPISPCLGFETDTFNLYEWNGSTWNLLGLEGSLLGTGLPNTISSTAASTVGNTTITGIVPGSYKVHAEAQFTANASAGNANFQIGFNMATSLQWGNGYIWQASGTGAGANRFTANTNGLIFQGPAMVSGAVYIVQINGGFVATAPGAISLQAFTSAAADTFTVNSCLLEKTPV